MSTNGEDDAMDIDMPPPSSARPALSYAALQLLTKQVPLPSPEVIEEHLNRSLAAGLITKEQSMEIGRLIVPPLNYENLKVLVTQRALPPAKAFADLVESSVSARVLSREQALEIAQEAGLPLSYENLLGLIAREPLLSASDFTKLTNQSEDARLITTKQSQEVRKKANARRRTLRAKAEREEAAAMWKKLVLAPENTTGRTRRQAKFAERLARPAVQRPSLEEYLGPGAPPSFYVVYVDTSLDLEKEAHEARIDSIVGGFRHLVEAQAFAALLNDMIRLEDRARAEDADGDDDGVDADEPPRHTALSAVAIPVPPCTITLLNGTKTFELPAAMPLASHSVLATELLAQMDDVRLPLLKKDTAAHVDGLIEAIEKVIKVHHPKLTAATRTAWAQEYVRYAVEHHSAMLGDSASKRRDANIAIPHDATLWDEHIAALVEEPLHTVSAMWEAFRIDRKVARYLQRIVQLADWELPEAMLGQRKFNVAPPGMVCDPYPFGTNPEAFQKQQDAIVDSALAASLVVYEDEMQRRKKPQAEKDEEEKELLSDVDF